MPRKSPSEWARIQREYEHGLVSLRELARRHKLSHTAVAKKAKVQGWRPPGVPADCLTTVLHVDDLKLLEVDELTSNR